MAIGLSKSQLQAGTRLAMGLLCSCLATFCGREVVSLLVACNRGITARFPLGRVSNRKP